MIHPASESPHFAKKKKGDHVCVCLFPAVLRVCSTLYLSLFAVRVCAPSAEAQSTRSRIASEADDDASAQRRWSSTLYFIYVCALLQGGRWRKKKDPSLVLLLFLMFRGETVIVLLTSNSTCSNPSYCHGRARLFQSLLWPSSQSLPLGLQCIFFFCAVRVCCESMWRFTFSFFSIFVIQRR